MYIPCLLCPHRILGDVKIFGIRQLLPLLLQPSLVSVGPCSCTPDALKLRVFLLWCRLSSELCGPSVYVLMHGVWLQGLVKRFFSEKEVTSTLVMDALFCGCKAIEEASRQQGLAHAVRLPSIVAHYCLRAPICPIISACCSSHRSSKQVGASHWSMRLRKVWGYVGQAAIPGGVALCVGKEMLEGSACSLQESSLLMT